jgi:GGDEF domain-containing protein
MRRRLAPALRGRITRRALAHSPAVWNVMGATLVAFGLVHVVVAATVPAFDSGRLLFQAALVATLGTGVLLTRPPQLDSPGAHVVVAAVYLSIATAVYAHAPFGAVALVSAVFIPLILAIWFDRRAIVSAHLLAAGVALVVASLAGDETGRTLTATLCILPATAMMLGVVMAVFDAMEAQTSAMDRFVRSDPLTGAGNERMLAEELSAELTRQRGLAGRFALIDVAIDGFDTMEARIGHAAADAVLTALAHALQTVAMPDSTVTRLEGSTFVVVLPGADAGAAADAIQAVRTAFPGTLGGQPLILRGGYACSPTDGASATALRAIARERRQAASGAAVCGGTDVPPTWNVVLDQPEAVPMPALPRRVSRRDLATDPMAWRWIGAVTLANGLTIGAATHLIGVDPSPLTWVASGAMVLVGLARVFGRPPALSSVRTHVFVALGYLLPFGATWAAAPHGEWMIGAALLAPLGIVARLTDRPQIVAHLIAATVPSVVLAASGAVDEPTRVALASLVLVTWILGGCSAAVFKGAEAQWAEVTRLIGHDPLTGAATAPLFEERLAAEVVRHEELQLALLVGELDLDGFEATARTRGRAQAAELLTAVANAISAAAGPGSTVARIEGSRFRFLIPVSALDDADPFINGIETGVEAALASEPALRLRIGFAEIIAGADDPATAIARASERRTRALAA